MSKEPRELCPRPNCLGVLESPSPYEFWQCDKCDYIDRRLEDLPLEDKDLAEETDPEAEQTP